MSRASVARAAGVSPSYLSQMMTGKKLPSPKWTDLIADALHLSDVERQKLHVAVAKDVGFKL